MSGSKKRRPGEERERVRPADVKRDSPMVPEETEEETGMSLGWSVQWDLTALQEARGPILAEGVDGTRMKVEGNG